MDLEGTTALVTGGAVRIGRAIAHALAAEGAHVIVHYRRSEREATALCEDIRAQGVKAWALEANLADAGACERLVAEAVKCSGQLAILVNNAATFLKDDPSSVTAEELLSQFRVNLLAPMALMQAFAKNATARKIVNLLDRRIKGHDRSCTSYVVSKKALAELTRLAALEWAPGIAVNGVAPGAILPPPGEGPERVRDLAGRSPLGRQCTPEEVADAVLFLLKNDAVTGEILFVDGGQHLLGEAEIEGGGRG